MIMVSSELVGRGLRLRIPDVSPESVAGKTSGIRNLKSRPTSSEDTSYTLMLAMKALSNILLTL